MDAVTTPPVPANEPTLSYAPGTGEREELRRELDRTRRRARTIRASVGGRNRTGGGEERAVVEPHNHQHVLATYRNSTGADAEAAIKAAGGAAPAWRDLPFDERAAVILRAADLLTGPWRQRMNAATMLGQSKTVHQAEIEAVCELADFWRFNVHYARQILADQPLRNAPGVWNRSDWRPLEGFCYAVTPFNFTAIAANLPTAPALMGNTVLWKPAPTQQLAASVTMELLTEAGLPPGVISMLPGDGQAVSQVALAHPDLAGIHFTGSTGTFRTLWGEVGRNLARYRSYPRIVGETGGKDFVVAHPSADPEAVRVALLRGAFEYQGQKCSAVSRAYVARSVWQQMSEQLLADTEALAMGDPADFSNFLGAVIDDRAFAKHQKALARVPRHQHLTLLAGGRLDDSVGWFVRPTVVQSTDPEDPVFSEEYFGPILAVYVFEDRDYEKVVDQMEGVAAYALTGAVFARDRHAIEWTSARLRFAAGNFYVNDKPTGSVVGQQPFGGARASGTNDKAGSAANLLRWVSPRSVKENFVPPTEHTYPHMLPEEPE